jgi:hypothetical protein
MTMKKILFRPSLNWVTAVTDAPTPMSQLIPKWYKNKEVYGKNNWKNKRIDGKTIKTCVPVLDSMISGYGLRLPSDVNTFIDENGLRQFTWNPTDWMPIDTHHPAQVSGYPIPMGYENNPFKFMNVWGVEAPKGYSLLFCHPFGRHDLPFYSFHGLVDSDLHYVPMHIPFVMKDGWEGVLEKGTVFAQVIPIKRDSWKGEIRDVSEFDVFLVGRKIMFHIERWYKNFIWVKKDYK